VLADLLAQVAVPHRAPQSHFELVLLRALRAAGLPDPEIQYRVDLPGDRSAYLDFAYPEHLLAIEADSFRHHSTLSGWSRDRTRNNALVVTGWRVLPVTYDDLVGSPESVVLQIRNALAAFGEAGSRRAGGLEALGGRAA
jgi:very-short-patch-repair endonuclease